MSNSTHVINSDMKKAIATFADQKNGRRQDGKPEMGLE
jgi:hypothetical protein